MSEREHTPPWISRIAAVAFDMDGLLVNTEELYSEVGTRLLARRNRTFTSELKDAMTGLPGVEAFKVMIERESLSDSIETLSKESAEIFQEILPQRLKLLPGVESLLEHLEERGINRCVATSSTHRFAERVLSLTNLKSKFSFVITSEDVERGKPHPDIYQGAAKRLQVAEKQMLVLEDSHHGSRAGVTAGACTIAVPGPHSQHHDFSGVHFVANTLNDLRIRDVLH